MPIITNNLPFRRHRERTFPAGSGAPVLVDASFPVGGPTLTMTFDRAIDLSGLIVSDIVVLDGAVPVEWGGTADVTPIGDNAFTMTMIENGEYTGSEELLSVPGGAGIKAADGGESWAGVTDLPLPFP